MDRKLIAQGAIMFSGQEKTQVQFPIRQVISVAWWASEIYLASVVFQVWIKMSAW